MLFNTGVKLHGFKNHLQSGYSPSPSKREGTLKLPMISSGGFKISFCSTLRNNEECLNTRESYILPGKQVATSRNNKLALTTAWVLIE